MFPLTIAIQIYLVLGTFCAQAAAKGGARMQYFLLQQQYAQQQQMQEDAADAHRRAMRFRRDTLCHDIGDGKQHCTSIQCDPEYGWCAHCSYSATQEDEKNVTMSCTWIKIRRGDRSSTTSNAVPTSFAFIAVTIGALLFAV